MYTPDAAHEKENVTWLTKRWQAQQIEIERMTKQNAALQDAPRAARELMRSPEIAVLRADAVRELAALLPMAVRRARDRRGSPALLRLILRSLKTL